MPPKPRKIPMRMCVGCREMKPKKELLRVVRSPEGLVSLDPTGKKPGRGAYCCYNAECLRRALRQGQLDRQLEVRLGEEVNAQADANHATAAGKPGGAAVNHEIESRVTSFLGLCLRARTAHHRAGGLRGADPSGRGGAGPGGRGRRLPTRSSVCRTHAGSHDTPLYRTVARRAGA